jgi:hypothetical protein
VREGLLDELVGVLALGVVVERIQCQPLHRQGFSVRRVPLEDGIGRLDGLLVLLPLVVPDDRPEQIELLFGERPVGPHLRVVAMISVVVGHDLGLVCTRSLADVTAQCEGAAALVS